ncbi:hypothetical protein Sru01_69890 [Sphaerisporangium rufum]|uniref:Uncharacterized protein n=1 Tax=Sphaerisporangium rufum TaxID=1381558 RepID=A0A919R994_9ACTN|nr:hypothetical protein Sru01_69890 [Sphaerisporangium rufum]
MVRRFMKPWITVHHRPEGTGVVRFLRGDRLLSSTTRNSGLGEHECGTTAH